MKKTAQHHIRGFAHGQTEDFTKLLPSSLSALYS